MVKFKDLGPVSAYALAKAHGYTGTEDQWAREQAAAGQNARIALESKNDAVAARDAAKEQAANALKSAQNAGQAEKSAIQEATVASNSAKEAMAHSTNAKTEAKNASTSATNAATNATEARNEADRAKTEADRAVSTVRKTLEDAKTSGEFDGPKGETGDSGVVISDTEPTDPNVSVWFRRSGTPVTARNIIADIPPELPSDTEKTVQAVLQVLASRKSSDGNKVAPAIPETLTGPVVATDIVSPLEHEVECKVENKNLIPYPLDGSNVNPGVSIIENADGSISINGTTTEFGNYYFAKRLLIKPGKYVVSTSGDYSIQGDVFAFVTNASDGKVIKQLAVKSGETASGFTIETGVSVNVYIVFNKKGAVCSGRLYLQIERGSVATPYTPYVPDLSKVTVSRYGRNIISLKKWLDDLEVEYTQDREKFTIKWSVPLYTNHLKLFSEDTLATVTCKGKSLGLTNFRLRFEDKEGNNAGTYDVFNENGTSKTLTFSSIYMDKSEGTDFELSELQIEVGPVGHPYDPHVDPQVLTSAPDGTITGMTSLSPSMTILTDTPGVTVEATYNADTKGFIKREIANQNAAQTAAYERGVSNA